MKILPAIDILDGSCVRLYKGSYSESTLYSDNPVEIAVRLCSSGCKRIHIVDLDAARGGEKNNRDVISKLRLAIPDVVMEVGGGIRSEKDIEELLTAGADRLILGTSFAKDPERARRWVKKYGSVFIAGIDSLNGQVKISGWEEDSLQSDTEVAVKAAENGMAGIIYTNIGRDGTLEGPDIEGSIRIAEVSRLPVIISGGIKDEEDFKTISQINHENIVGVITGKALYENRIDLKKMVMLYDDGSKGECW